MNHAEWMAMTPADYRNKLQLSPQEMADLMGVHVMTWRKWESGERPPNAAAVRLLGMLGALADADRLHIAWDLAYPGGVEVAKR